MGRKIFDYERPFPYLSKGFGQYSVVVRHTLHYPYYLLSIAYCLLSIVYCLLPIVYCLLPIAYCLLPIAYCLLPTVYCYANQTHHRYN
jgi:hypothetical protein